jgi:hypothetical protein
MPMLLSLILGWLMEDAAMQCEYKCDIYRRISDGLSSPKPVHVIWTIAQTPMHRI